MSKNKIQKIITGFGKAAVLAKQAGFDMVQVHGDRMCGSFGSAIFNHCTDEYGGSIPLCPMQQEVSRRLDGTSGHPLHL